MEPTIIVMPKEVRERFPKWVRACPQCGEMDSDTTVYLESANRCIDFSLCRQCAIELAHKIIAHYQEGTR